jgi:hypothetical protein
VWFRLEGTRVWEGGSWEDSVEWEAVTAVGAAPAESICIAAVGAAP